MRILLPTSIASKVMMLSNNKFILFLSHFHHEVLSVQLKVRMPTKLIMTPTTSAIASLLLFWTLLIRDNDNCRPVASLENDASILVKRLFRALCLAFG